MFTAEEARQAYLSRHLPFHSRTAASIFPRNLLPKRFPAEYSRQPRNGKSYYIKQKSKYEKNI